MPRACSWEMRFCTPEAIRTRCKFVALQSIPYVLAACAWRGRPVTGSSARDWTTPGGLWTTPSRATAATYLRRLNCFGSAGMGEAHTGFGRLKTRRMNLTYQVAANLGRHLLSTCPVASDFRGAWTSTRLRQPSQAGQAGQASQALGKAPARRPNH